VIVPFLKKRKKRGKGGRGKNKGDRREISHSYTFPPSIFNISSLKKKGRKKRGGGGKKKKKKKSRMQRKAFDFAECLQLIFSLPFHKKWEQGKRRGKDDKKEATGFRHCAHPS